MIYILGSPFIFVVMSRDVERYVTSLRLILLYRRSCNNRATLVLSDLRFLDTVKSISFFVRTLENEHGVPALLDRARDIGASPGSFKCFKNLGQHPSSAISV